MLLCIALSYKITLNIISSSISFKQFLKFETHHYKYHFDPLYLLFMTLKSTHIWKAIKALSLLGILLAFYLFYSYLTRPTFQPCYVNSSINCDAVIKGPLATIFGVPVSLIGLVGYIIILISSIIKNKKLLLVMSTFGLLFCLSLIYQEIFVLKVICPVCVTCLIVMFTIFLLGIKLNLEKTSS